MKATRKITKLRVNEMSLVGEGDNPDADVLILKHRDIVGVNFDVAKQALADVRKDAIAMAKELSEGGFEMDIKELETKLDGIEKSLKTAEGENAKLTAQIATITKERDDAAAKLATTEADLEKAKKAVKVPAKAQADGGADDPDADDEVMKSLPASVRERIEKSEKVAKDALEQVEKARDEREELSEIEKVKATGLTEADKFGKLVHRVRKGKSTAEDADALLDLIAKAKAIRDEGKALFTPVGKSVGRDVTDDGASAQAKLDEAVEAIQKAKPALTPAQAYDEAITANPALYEAVSKIRPTADA